MSERTATSVTCPKCGHVRSGTETVPAWQCPRCGIAYHKYQLYLERARKIVTPPSAVDAAPGWTEDGSVWSLVAVNVLALAIAWHQDWDALSLMALYWGQSVIIGIANVFRILALDRFSTENFTINNQRVGPTTETKIKVAGFFAVHYGFFHIVYMIFIFAGAKSDIGLFDSWFMICIAAFALNHYWSYRYNRDLDRQGTPNIGTLMFTPYLRIIPMHLTIIFGGMALNSGKSLLLFGVLKTLADAGMHLVEHAQLKKVRVSINKGTMDIK